MRRSELVICVAGKMMSLGVRFYARTTEAGFLDSRIINTGPMLGDAVLFCVIEVEQ